MLVLLLTLLSSCGSEGKKAGVKEPGQKEDYLGLLPGAQYVGMQACRNCHEDIYQTFIKTGMGRSFGVAGRQRSAADYTNAHLYDKFSDLHYRAGWVGDSLYFREYRLEGKDTVHQRSEMVSYIIGSGQHTNSHLRNENGYLYQMPMTYYTQKGRWDLPPGFENGVNTRFSRKIGIECMSCHNAFPGFVSGSENKFTRVPQGIDCERCHGPGSFHVEARTTTERVDTARYIDYSIVNPAKLPVDRQFDICQRCHLQGNALLKEGHSFFDFKPGMVLSDHISVFLPKYRNGEDQFIMASHAERLKMSPCFIRSLAKADTSALKPYKKAMTCITCHDPHVSVRETNPDVFNQACRNCHGDQRTLEGDHRGISKWNDCVSCHMPVSGSTDIPHVSVHDHFIRKPLNKNDRQKIAEFLGLYAVNEKHPAPLTRARAYLDQYEKFSQDRSYLDSAWRFLQGEPVSPATLRATIQLHFVRREYSALIALLIREGTERCLKEHFITVSDDNADAWTLYRAGEAFLNTGREKDAALWLGQAVRLAPYVPDFRNKLSTVLLSLGDKQGAAVHLDLLLRENPGFASAYVNMGYLRMTEGSFVEARRLLLAGLRLDPDNETLLLNLATCHAQLNEKDQAIRILELVVKRHPSHLKARQALLQLKAS